jgi:hypothetical protein
MIATKTKTKNSYCIDKSSKYISLVHPLFEERLNKKEKRGTDSHFFTIEKLANVIISKDITLFEAKEFINELIENQILISELEPSVTGNDLIIQLKNKLNRLGCENEYIDMIILLLCQFDNKKIGTKYNIYKEITNLLSILSSNPKKNCLHVDCMIPSQHASISNQICETVLKGLSVLSHLAKGNENSYITTFKESFFKRYENQEIPLVIALDPQVGVGFGNWQEMHGDVNPLINDLAIQSSINQNLLLQLDSFSQFFVSKYEDCIKNSMNSITITKDDMKFFNSNIILDTFPNQLYTMIKVVDIHKNTSNPTIFIHGFNGPSSINLLTRFGYLDTSINEYIKEVADDETRFYDGKIMAEISHLPEDRIGNIQMHPHYREYEISYLSNPYDLSTNVKSIPISDIMVSVPNGQKIILRSKNYNKEIIPRLSTAHNFSNGLPIYHFLCTIQHQNSRHLYFDWGQYFNTKPFLPRVIYENIILSPAKWRIIYSDLPKKNDTLFDDYYKNLIEWKNSKGIPDLVEIVEYDNTLLIDFSKKIMVKLFINHITKKGSCTIEEYLFVNTKHSFVKRGNSHFTHELILCLHKTYST